MGPRLRGDDVVLVVASAEICAHWTTGMPLEIAKSET